MLSHTGTHIDAPRHILQASGVVERRRGPRRANRTRRSVPARKEAGLPARSLVAALAALIAAAPANAAQFVNFACADGSKISLIFERQGTGLVMVGGGALRLQNRHPASGLWYASPYGDLRAKGATATFRMQDRAPTTCRKAR